VKFLSRRVLSRFVDERFLTHRLRSTSKAGMVAAALAIVLFEYRLIRFHVWDWNLLTVGVAFVVVKLGLMTWYSRTD
jgi:hypothetical protein